MHIGISLTAAVASLSFASMATAGITGMTFTDSTNDLFDNGFTNLDISSVTVSNDATNVYISVSTVGFSNWTKYGIFLNADDNMGSSSHPWNRPHDLAGQNISGFIGSWVDSATDNAQFWSYDSAWTLLLTNSNSVSAGVVTFTFNYTPYLSVGDVLRFDVGTSGGGGSDPWVDLLSRSTQSTSGWGSASTAGTFMSYTLVPSPGAVALIGLTALISRRRRA